jgi:hypothetical protein
MFFRRFTAVSFDSITVSNWRIGVQIKKNPKKGRKFQSNYLSILEFYKLSI